MCERAESDEYDYAPCMIRVCVCVLLLKKTFAERTYAYASLKIIQDQRSGWGEVKEFAEIRQSLAVDFVLLRLQLMSDLTKRGFDVSSNNLCL